ncbi:methionine aminopeptidase 1 (1) [Moniliophthora roreri MCA 2997]|uniref:Methionine aminopeptidase 1 ( 1) n=2 Tax=Moniliophthora roreri TaxID=221103 RepID=V2XT01_MONRO|nr:methionine aminopeptidase 1 (1) [Moniliophthora roreri MCA 2997]
MDSNEAVPTEWSPEFDSVLAAVASTDLLQGSWFKLRSIIKLKLSKNIALFLQDPNPPPPPPAFIPTTLASGGLKLPPFPPRHQTGLTSFEPPVNYMNEAQAAQMKQYIYDQLDEFDSDPPFTIQRVCELCLQPKKHYKAVGKYLRAVEKSLLVTSSKDSFPPITDNDTNNPTRSISISASTSQSTPTTPLFSPIPFLHEDARRSKSRSPPPSPLALSALGPVSGGHPEALGTKALGLVDELDDPGPGHMSEHPTALTSVTSIDEGKEGTPIVQSLEERFVKSSESESESKEKGDGDAMIVDENKENTGM